VRFLNSKKIRDGDFVLYWMQSSQRAEDNWALSYATQTANSSDLPIVVYFGLTTEFPEANCRHYWFMLEGLKEVSTTLQSLGVRFVIKHANPPKGLMELAEKASQIIVDKGYLRTNKEWYKYAAQRVQVPIVQIEDNVVVPVEETSQKEEYSAATLRPKLLMKLSQFLDIPHKYCRRNLL
jgi:deoxyribodipyrimidine photo-lyase